MDTHTGIQKASLPFVSQSGLIRELKPPPPADGVTVLAIVKNEAFYLPAFLDHYRRLGVSRFVFLDDGSDDEGLGYLLQQPDCGVVVSDLGYSGFVGRRKVDLLWRSALPLAYAEDKWSILVDVDEFLLLPPGFDALDSFTRRLDAMRARVVGAVMLDFYPANVADLADTSPPNDAAELFARYPYFDDCPHGRWAYGRFRQTYGGMRARLVIGHGIQQKPPPPSLARSIKSGARKLVGLAKPQGFNAIYKVPLVRWKARYEHVNSHRLNVSPRSDIQLPLAHFKLSGSFVQKIDYAVSSGAYNAGSLEYRAYIDLLDAMRRGDGSFLCERSRAYSGNSDFVASELVRFPGVTPRSIWPIF